ncbi:MULTISPECIES: phage tail protein [unclassified Leptolyngbya]|uniref:phage tail protein n=1 Tax=unclassified Leptolyngbya TaxID=2650499 RepID=UPI0016862191|nr:MULTISPECIES: phage tail protein [unclassified Leptolyngbya]MBD1909751.1 phage tail protein [Leptolyngbya sp. FACHB-8]MBD2157649.1 phage tail protein [Leptolyngbya sp. FACHB-16]
MMQQEEVLVSCRFYFEADGVTDKQILEVSGLSSETPAAGGDKVLGSGKNAINLRQATPTRTKFTPVVIKLVATTNKDLYRWYEDCNRNEGGRSDWSSSRKAASVSVYDQAGDMKARWELLNAYPTKYEGPKLEAGANDVANETLTLVHEGIKRVM